MGRSQESWNKKEVRNKKEKNRKDKEKKRLERKNSNRNGNNLDEMIAYVDEFGKLTSTPPDLANRIVVKAEDIELGAMNNRPLQGYDSIRKGVVTFFNNSKGYGFIRDLGSQESVFVHINEIEGPIKENDKVVFEVERGPKGMMAVRVKPDLPATSDPKQL